MNNFWVESWDIVLKFSTFSIGGCWGQPMLLFWKLVDKTQMYKPLEPTRHHNLIKLLILLPLRAELLFILQYEIPCRTPRNKYFIIWKPIIIHMAWRMICIKQNQITKSSRKKNVKWETLFQMSNSFAMVVMKMRTNAQSGYFLLHIFTTYAILYTSNNRPWRQKMKSLRLSIAQLRSLQ